MTEQPIEAAYYRGGNSFAVEIKTSRPPKYGEVSIRVAYCGICGTDMHVFHGFMDKRVGLNRIIGHEMSGVVEEVGPGCTDVCPGQRVVVRPLDDCGDCPACNSGHRHVCHNLNLLGLDSDGAMQEIWTVPSHTLHTLPEELRLDHAALVEPLAVACHDVRLSELAPNENVVVIGGGPIGILVAVVARKAGGCVLVSEVNSNRIVIARKLGFDVINPLESDLVAEVNRRTSMKGADIVFEVSGSQAGVDSMTAIASARARLVMVAIHARKPKIDMFQFFWRELRLIGTRLYEPRDYEKAIAILASDNTVANTIITDVNPLPDIQRAFEELDSNPQAMKSLIKVGCDT